MPTHGFKGKVYTQCPYYICESETRIVCEGYKGNTNNTTGFKSESEKELHQKTYCFDVNHFRDCSYCIVLDAKYKLIENGLKADTGEPTAH